MKRLVCAFVLGLIGSAAAAVPAWANGTLSTDREPGWHLRWD